MESAIAQQMECKKQSDYKENVFVRHIFDRETGQSLICRYKEGENPAQTFGFNWWSTDAISYDEVMRQAVEALRMEQKRAVHVQEMLKSGEAAKEKAARMEAISGRARRVFDEMVEIEAPDLELYRRLEQGELSEEEYQEKQAQMQRQLLEKESTFSEAMEQMKELDKVFDRRNPWIRLYADMEIPEVLTKEQVRKWIGRLLVEEFSTVQLEIPAAYAKWKALLPAAWIEDA